MPPSLRSPRLKFQSKVVIPVIIVMTLLLALTVWIVNRRFTSHADAEVRQTLATARAVFIDSQTRRSRNLGLLYSHVANAPKVKAALSQGAESKTVAMTLNELLRDEHVDWTLFSDATGRLVTNSTGSDFGLTVLAMRSLPAVDQAFATRAPGVDSIRIKQDLYDVVSIPIYLDNALLGAITFGIKFSKSEPEDFKHLTQTEIVFLDKAGVIASTLGNPEYYPRFVEIFTNSTKREKKRGLGSEIALERLTLEDESFLCAPGEIPTLTEGRRLGYLLLYSNARSVAEMRQTQRMLLGMSLAVISLGAVTIWGLVRKVTQPLRELRDSSEAIGRGDFSHRTKVHSKDEFGELAASFNQMTTNLEISRAELEKTVENLTTTRAQLVQSEKLSAIGEFVAGVAHELNNPLTCVIGFSELLKESQSDKANRPYFDMISESAHRCHKIVHGLLSFARQHPPERKLANLNEIIETTLGFVEYDLRTGNIKVSRRLSTGLPKVLADPHQLQQVFFNLINNARQSMESHRGSGSLEIITEVADGSARVIFRDDGPGISPQNLSKIFDPFFTTKPVGKGTGLGLSLSYGIIQEHGGDIKALSPPGQGAMFIVRLPFPAPPKAADLVDVPSTEDRAGVSEGTGKNILVIDDEESILQLTRSTLTPRGYRVDTVSDGESALRLVAENRYDLILCDWKMPGLNGEQVHARLHSDHPVAAAKMVFMTGDIMNDRTQKFLLEKNIYCISKPFSLEELRGVIKRMSSES